MSRIPTPEEMRTLWPRGTRVRLLAASDPYTRLRPGAAGTVRLVDSVGTVHVLWDNGSTLGLIPGEDKWELI